ncbi:hypothetical protein EMCRGX_G007192 [Ephydatia muelleri]
MNSVMTEQIEIQLYNDIYRYLKDSEYRPNATKNDKRAIRRIACSFVLRDGLLYFTEDGADSTAKQWIVDKESQMKAVDILDATRLFRKSVRRDMTKHIKEYVNTFEQCQKANPKMIKETSAHPISVKTEVWHQIGIDLVGPLKLTRRGNRPRCEFVNSLNEKLFEIAGVEHQVSSAYHPQTNGLDERMNQTLTKAIVKYINTEQDDWDEHIESVLFSYRTSVHASTKFTTFYLMYGREAVLPVQLQLIDRNQDGSVVDELHVENDTVQLYATQLEKIKKELFPKVDVNI